ncbi:MAG: Type 1 glutamine amidotransferase-like domain-containing protein [Acholeplasmataceae bacterium]
MKLLLTSAGIKNESIKNELLTLLNNSIEDTHAICITTSSYHLKEGFLRAFEFVSGISETPMCELKWKSIGLMELSILHAIDETIWKTQIDKADVILVNGGDPMLLNYFMKSSGFFDYIKNKDIVYVGLSAGSMIMAPSIGQDFVGWQKLEQGDQTLGVIDFSIFPHLNHPMLPDNILENAIKWKKTLNHKAYAIDDQSAISVVDDQIKVISEGIWYDL